MKHKPVRTDYHWRKRRIILFLLTILLIFLIPAVILICSVFRHVSYMNVFNEAFPLQNIYKPKEFKLTDVEHVIHTEDGEDLWCSEIAADSPKAVIIYLSGLKEPSVTYFYGHAAWMKKQNIASFLLEVRAHGKSSGKKLGLGYTETEDVRALVKYIKGIDKYRNVPIIVQGVDLGGTIAVNAAGLIPEIDACIAMSPYAAMDTHIDILMKKYHIPGFLRAVEKPILHQALRILYGKDAADRINPEIQIQNAGDKPVLVISSLNDPTVPAGNTLALQSASSNAEIWIRNSADHYVILNDDFKNVEEDTEYCTYISGFLFKVIRGK